jgi:uroporphyrinogen decarboxylase
MDSVVQPGRLAGEPVQGCPMLDVLAGRQPARRPIWLMRQAGRYLPEYRSIRSQAKDFLAFCYNAELAAEATLQPIERFGFDAAIIFSDILVVPDALGRSVRFVEGEGPRLDPITSRAEIDALPADIDLDRLRPTLDALGTVRAALPAHKALLGFCGAPWTVATYMIGGRGSPDQAAARQWAYSDPAGMQALMDRLVAASVAYLVAQLRAGADAVQVFDSWAGSLPLAEFARWGIAPVQAIVAGVRAQVPGARIIGFPRGVSEAALALFLDQVPVDAVSVDTTGPQAAIGRLAGGRVALQGNLDPLALVAGGDGLDGAVDAVLDGFAGTRHIFNLGHGILPHTPIEHVHRMLERVRARDKV